MSEERGRSAGEDHERRQKEVLLEVLERSPLNLTLEELVRTQILQRIGDENPEPVEHAITELRRDGLLRLNGDVIEPTAAAIRANQLLLDMPL